MQNMIKEKRNRILIRLFNRNLQEYTIPNGIIPGKIRTTKKLKSG